MKQLKGKHKGQPCGVLCGGASLIDDLASVPKDALKIGVNHHPNNLGIGCDYWVFFDKHTSELLGEVEGAKLSRFDDVSDICVKDVPPGYGQSGILAVWLALYMGCDPVYVCGADLYQTKDNLWCDDTQGELPTDYIENINPIKFDLNWQLERWSWLFHHADTSRIKPISGHLVKLFGGYEMAKKKDVKAKKPANMVKVKIIKRDNHELGDGRTLSLHEGREPELELSLAKVLEKKGVVKILIEEKE